MPGARPDGGRVRTVALAAVRRRADGALLLGIGTDPATRRQFCRPVGGGIEEGESPEEAARREWIEEVGVAIGGLRPLAVLDNRYVYAGKPGREVTHLFEARLEDASLEARGEFPVAKKSSPKIARWFPPEHLGEGRARLVPEGLAERLGIPALGPVRCVAFVGERARGAADALVFEARRDPALVAGVEGLGRLRDRGRLREAGFALWPADAARLPLAVAIEPESLGAPAGDAAACALAMERRIAELLSLPAGGRGARAWRPWREA